MHDFVTSCAGLAKVATGHIEQFGLAVHEIATNVIEHGGRDGVLQIWTGLPTMVCEISDTGA